MKINSAALVTFFCVTAALSGCNRAEPGKPAVPTPAPGPAAATVPPAPVVAPAPLEAGGEAPVAAGSAAGGPAKSAKGAATNRAKKPPVLRSVRSASQAGFDRFVFEFDTPGLPAWRSDYLEGPVLDCGSGEPVRVAGEAWLQITFTGAQGHNEQGKSTSGARRRKLSQTIGRELVRTCDFEGEVTWVIGVARANPYTPRVMTNPSRLVIDVTH
jgi:hypothetical protein